MEKFPQQTRCLVAIKDEKIVGTASINRYRGSDELEKKYIIQTVFVKIEEHKQGIGTKLITAIEQVVREIGAKEIVILTSTDGRII